MTLKELYELIRGEPDEFEVVVTNKNDETISIDRFKFEYTEEGKPSYFNIQIDVD